MAIRNWAGNQRWDAHQVAIPSSADEVAAIVGDAANRGGAVKPIGSGHSFTDIALTDQTLMRLDNLDSVLIDGDQVTVGAGIPLHRLNAALAEAGLALPILGDIDRQTVAGAIATGTHGTGIGHRAIADAVIGFELVDGTGERRRGAAEGTATERELLRVGRVNLGALGVLTQVTLQCVPRFNLHAVDSHEPVAAVLDDFDAFATSAEHAEFFWMPGAEIVNARRNRPTEQDAAPGSKIAEWFNDYITENLALAAGCTVGRFVPRLAPHITRWMATATAERDVVDRSDRVFASRRMVKFVEMEYGFPIEYLPELIQRVIDIIGRAEFPVLFPIEVRVSAGDDIPLSPGMGRTNGWIAVHQFIGAPYKAFFAAAEALFNEYPGARPHWGKLHTLTADDLRDHYPGWADFHQLRRQLDPNLTFSNDYTRRVLDA